MAPTKDDCSVFETFCFFRGAIDCNDAHLGSTVYISKNRLLLESFELGMRGLGSWRGLFFVVVC